MNDRPLIVFAGGGSGGHLYPSIAMIEWLREHRYQVDFECYCTSKPIDVRVLAEHDIPFQVQSVRPFRRAIHHWPMFALGWHWSNQLCKKRFRNHRPEIVFGMGGYGAAPAINQASKRGIRTALFNPDMIPGRANRYLAQLVDEVYVQWPESTGQFAGHPLVKAVGCPLRREFYVEKSDRDYTCFNLEPGRKTLLITGASLGARSINDAVVGLLSDLVEVDWQILHLTGQEDHVRVRTAYERTSIQATVLPFTPHMASALRCADLAVARAGAITVAELIATHTPSVLLPYPHHRDQHQKANARVVADRGAAIVLQDRGGKALVPELREVLLPLLNQGDSLRRLTEMAQKLPSTDAAELLGKRLASLLQLQQS